MVFSSNIFLFLFLPVFLAVYYLTPFKWKSVVILLGSYIFYAWWRIDFSILLMGLMFWSHWIALRIGKALEEDNQKKAKTFLIAGVVANLSVLGYFKYWNFGVDTLSAIMIQAGWGPLDGIERVLLPIGVSFFVFHAISYIVDIYRRDAHPVKRFADFAAFMTLFPQLVAGPVLRFKDLAWQFENREHNFDKFSEGAYRFMMGFAKKVLIADTVAALADAAFASQNPTMMDSWLGALAYTVQLYFDFSGYSDMAVGLGLMMGFRLIENFNYPYISKSITEFWRRWHISLSTWLRDYLYIPLGGSRQGKVRTYVNLFTTMLLGGLWHGANWTFVIWGAWHGGILAIERALGVREKPEDAPDPVVKRIVMTVLTFFFVILGWVMFRAANVTEALKMYKGMFGFSGFSLSDAMSWQVTGLALSAMIIGGLIVFVGPWIEKKLGKDIKKPKGTIMHIVAIVLFILAVLKLSFQSFSPFLYFQF